MRECPIYINEVDAKLPQLTNAAVSIVNRSFPSNDVPNLTAFTTLINRWNRVIVCVRNAVSYFLSGALAFQIGNDGR